MAEGSLKRRWLALSRYQRWSFILSLLLLFYTVFGFFILPAIVRSQLETKLTETLHRQTTVAEVKINPFTLRCAVNGFQIRDRDKRQVFVSFDSLQLNVQGASLFKLAVIVKSISLINPSVNVALHDDLSWNFSDLLVSAKDKKEEIGEEKKPLPFSLNNIEISGGKFHFKDQVEGMTHEVTDLHLAIPYVSSLPSDIEIFIHPAFEAVINGTAIGMKGGSKPFHASVQSEFDINFTDIDLTKYLTYLPDDLGFDVHSGLLDLTLAFNFMQHEDGKPAVKIQGTVGLRDVDIRDRKNQPLLSFTEMTVDIDRVHIMRKEFHLARFSLREPSLTVERLKNGEINLATLFPASTQEEKTAQPTDNPLLFNLKEAVIDGATIHFTDQTVPGHFQTTLQPLKIQVENFSTAHESMADFLLAFTSERGEEVTVEGSFSSLPLHVIAGLNVTNIQLDKYRPYYQGALAAALNADKTDVRANIEFAPENHIFMITDAGLDTNNLSFVGDRVEENIIIPHFAISGTTVDVTEQKIFIDQCTSSDGVIPLVRRKDGSLNVQDFLVKAATDEPVAEPLEEDDADAGVNWILVAKNVDFTNYSSTFTDQVPGQPVLFSFDKFNLAGANITNELGEKGRIDLDFHLNETATAKVRGSVGFAPLSVALDLGVKGVPFKAAQPYMDGKVNAIIGSGTGELTGSLSLASQDDNFAVNFHGNVGSHTFSLLDAKAEKLLSWESFLIQELDVTTTPIRVSMETVVVDGIESFVSINEDGQLNMASLAGKDGSTVDETQAGASGRLEQEVSPEIEIGQVKLLNSRLDFVDRKVSPPFTTSLQDIQGQIKGLSSNKDAFADIDISATLGRHSPMTISGKIHPWQDFFTDLTVGLHDIELSPMSPYSLKFIGYPLAKGKLSLDLHYLVDGKKLTSENKVFIDQITLGDFVENDTATSLPVQLAISLLKNRAGEIALDIPVSGELDDPEFSVAGVVFTVIKNLLVKAATSPFALLGSLFPDNRDFLFVEFEPGVTNVIGRDDEKWAVFAKAMYDHPALKLEVIGFVDPEKDAAAMTRINFDRQLKVQKLKDLVKQKQAVADVDEVVVNPEDYEKYLKKAYKAATFKRPRNFLGLLKGLPPAEMEKLIYDHIVISDDNLHQLGMDRATIIKDYLVEAGPIEPERIFLLQPKNSRPDDEDLPALRVEIVAR
jgi:hypothetical protein